jgi:hypothetical protein
MCSPAIGIALLTGVAGAVVSKALAPKVSAPAPAPVAAPPPPPPEPAVQQEAADVTAANTANQKAAGDAKVRRANVLALGGQSDTLGASNSAITNVAKTSVLGGGAV